VDLWYEWNLQLFIVRHNWWTDLCCRLDLRLIRWGSSQQGVDTSLAARPQSDLLKQLLMVHHWTVTANFMFPGIPKFLHVQTSCPYLVWDRERLAEIRRGGKWTGSKPVCTKQRAKQTYWPNNGSNLPCPPIPPPPHHHWSRTWKTLAIIHHWVQLLRGPYASVCQCMFSMSVSLSHGIEMGGKRGEAASHIIQRFQSSASQQPTVAGLKEALCEGQTDGHRMKTVMKPSTAQCTHALTYRM